jgi:hypothetical protein
MPRATQRLHAEGRSKTIDISQTRISFTTFDSPDVSSVKAAKCGQFFLGQAQFQSKKSDSRTKCPANILRLAGERAVRERHAAMFV